MARRIALAERRVDRLLDVTLEQGVYVLVGGVLALTLICLAAQGVRAVWP